MQGADVNNGGFVMLFSKDFACISIVFVVITEKGTMDSEENRPNPDDAKGVTSSFELVSELSSSLELSLLLVVVEEFEEISLSSSSSSESEKSTFWPFCSIVE
jgi:hypothetical protein